jgi:hypothetical protein
MIKLKFALHIHSFILQSKIVPLQLLLFTKSSTGVAESIDSAHKEKSSSARFSIDVHN